MKLVILDSYALREGDLDWSPLAPLVDTVVSYPRTAYADIIPRLRGADLAITNKARIDDAVLAACPRLRWVGVTATGTDVLDIEACRRHGVAVANVPSYSTHSVAQLTFALLLESLQHTSAHAAAVRSGYWQVDLPAGRAIPPAAELFGKTLGIVGYGEIGREVARIAAAFGMQVLVHTRTVRPEYAAHPVEFLPLEALLSRSDIVSLHCPATPATKGIINARTLALMRPGSVLVNTARGALVDEPALLAALETGRPAFFAADVAAAEPLPAQSPLRSHPRVLLTPHVAWTTAEALARLSATVCQNLSSFLQGRAQNIVNEPLCKADK